MKDIKVLHPACTLCCFLFFNLFIIFYVAKITLSSWNHHTVVLTSFILFFYSNCTSIFNVNIYLLSLLKNKMNCVNEHHSLFDILKAVDAKDVL